MRAAEVLAEGLISGINKQVAADLQKSLTSLGANLAKVKVVTSEGVDYVRVTINSKGRSLARIAVRRALDDYLLPRFGEENILGITYTISRANANNAYCIYFRQR